MLAVENVEVVYNDVVLVLRGVSLQVPDGKIVALLGANGAGKTTLLRAVSGLLDHHRGKVTKGSIHFGDDEITDAEASVIVNRGIGQVLEGRRIFPALTVDENLQSGGMTVSRREAGSAYERVMGLFPRLEERGKQTAGYLSGGEQQMLAIGRALMSDPRMLLLDEPSLGLAPKIQDQIREIILEVNRQGTAVLLVEQNANLALSIAEYGYVLEVGKVVLDGDAVSLRNNEDIREFYLGIGAEGDRKSFRDVKQYRRKKKWLS